MAIMIDIVACHFAKMMVMGEHNDLARCGKVRQRLEDTASPHIVGGHEHIIQYYRQVYTTFSLQFQGGQPPRPASHVRYDDMRHGQGDGEPTTGL